MDQESDSNTNCNWSAQYSHQGFGTESLRLRDKRTSGNYSIIEIGLNIKKNPKDLSWVVVENHQLTLV